MSTQAFDPGSVALRYGPLMRSAVRRVARSEADLIADDVQQEVLLALWRSGRGASEITAPAAYLYQAARREAVRALRRSRPAPLLDEPAVSGNGPMEALVHRDLCARLAAALAALRPDRRLAVEGHLAGDDVGELMGRHGWSYQKARNLVARGLGDLRRNLQDARLS